MAQIEELFQFVRSIKSSQMITNSVFTPPALQQLAERRKIDITIGQRAAVVYHPDEGNLLRLFFYAADQEALAEVVALTPPVPKDMVRVCDVLGKESHLQKLRIEMQQAGFRFYARFQRMVCKELPTSSPYDLSQVELATLSDVSEIQEMLRTEFDPITAHFPRADEIERMIEQKDVFEIRDQGQIAGFSLFESRNRQVACLGYVITRPPYRGQHIARKLLMAKVLLYNESRYYYLWINELCHDAILTHEKNGFIKDGTYDDIFTI